MTGWMLLTSGCFSLSPESATQTIGAALRAEVDGATVRHAVLHVDAPRKAVSGTWAAGVADAETGMAMNEATPFLSASIGKLLVAATVFDLADD
ncbi:MAG: serine hydrolase, partial [Myxococcota bacterium]